MEVEDDQNAVQEARLITDRLSDDSIDDVDEEDTEVEGRAQPCEGTDSEADEDISTIPFMKYIKVECADCGYPYNPTSYMQRHRHREHVKKH